MRPKLTILATTSHIETGFYIWSGGGDPPKPPRRTPHGTRPFVLFAYVRTRG
jgi:hypothetical protein